MRKLPSAILLIFTLIGCSYMLEVASTLDAKEIHDLMSNETTVYLRLKGLKEVQETFLNISPVSAFKKSKIFQFFLKSNDYANIQKGLRFAQWLFEDPPQKVFDNLFGQDVAITLVPKSHDTGFYGLLICELEDPKKALEYLDSFYQFVLRKEGILREKRLQIGGIPQEAYYFQNTRKEKRETFTMTIAKGKYLLLSNDENLVVHALHRVKENKESLFLQNVLVKETLKKLPEDRFLTFFANFERILDLYPALFQGRKKTDINKPGQLVEKKLNTIIRNIRTLGVSANLTKGELSVATATSLRTPYRPKVVSSSIKPISRYISEDTLGVFHLRHLNQLLTFLTENPLLLDGFKRLGVLFEGKDLLTEVLPKFGEEVTFLLSRQKNVKGTGSLAMIELPALSLFISGQEPESSLLPVLQSLNTILTMFSLEKRDLFRMEVKPYQGILIYAINHTELKKFGEQLSPCYAIVGDRLVLSTSLLAMKNIILQYQKNSVVLSKKHPLFSYLFNSSLAKTAKKLLASSISTFLSLDINGAFQILQKNLPHLQNEQEKDNAKIQMEAEVFMNVLGTFQNFTVLQEQDEQFVCFRAALKFD